MVARPCHCLSKPTTDISTLAAQLLLFKTSSKDGVLLSLPN